MHSLRLLVSFLTLLYALAGTLALAQEELRGPLQEVRVVGTDDADVVRVIIASRRGTPAQNIDLEAERNRVYSLGSFEEVSVSLQEEDGGPVLVVRVVENPTLGEVAFRGVEAVPQEQLLAQLARRNLLEPGRVYNTVRAEEGVDTIQAFYRARGFPFDVPVTVDTIPLPSQAEEGERPPVRLTYGVNEQARVESVAFQGGTVLEEGVLERVFRPLLRSGTFDPAQYRAAVDEVARRYGELGFRQSGVDLTRTELVNGRLNVRLRELTIVGVDTSALGVDASELSLGRGDLFNYDVLLEDVRRLAEGRGEDVRLVPTVTSNGEVRVRFEVGPPDTAGPIDEIEIEGNTVIPDEELRELLTLGVGDTFTSTLAEEDFRRIAEAYRERGYLIATQGRFNYLDGTYVQRVTEFKIGGYRVRFEGGRERTEDFVITRYMPPVGAVANDEAIIAGLRQVQRLGAVEPVGRTFAPGEAPDEVVVELVVRETATGLFQPAAQYSTDTGFSASVSYSESNLWGRAHQVEAELNGLTSDIGLMFGGSIRYTIPWLYVDALDFRRVPTSVSASVFSRVGTNNVLTADGQTKVAYPGLPDTEANQVFVGEYSQRDSGLSFSVGRAVFRDTTLRVSARGTLTEYKLEPPSTECTFDDGGDVENGNRCALPGDEARQYLPQGGLSSFVSTSLAYDDRDNPEFPRAGIAANGLVGVGFGSDYRNDAGEQQAYTYSQVEFGVKTYLALADLLPDLGNRNHVVAFRLNGGHQFGGAYPVSRRFRVGKTPNEATAIRGYSLEDFGLSRTYLTGSVEYRYDFGLETVATQTIIGIVFLDVGYASAATGFPEYGAPLFAGAGAGVQVNLGFGGVALPALRFDYGFSERNPSGEFRFRVGPVF